MRICKGRITHSASVFGWPTTGLYYTRKVRGIVDAWVHIVGDLDKKGEEVRFTFGFIGELGSLKYKEHCFCVN